jgi:pimeloyl-ACP methyl ester carboxylesterase
MVGYRGVDGSSVLDCPEVKEAMKNDEDDILSDESLKIIAKGLETGINRLKSNGTDLNGYSIPETIEDMEEVRNLFKYDKINLLSESYGTRVAYIYGLMHPEKIARSVMVAANPPGRFLWDPKIIDRQINYYSQLWAKDSVMSGKCSDLAGTIRKVLNNMPRKWLFFSINPGKVKVVAYCMLFHRKTAALVFNSFIAAENGDNSGLAMMSIAFNYILPGMFVFGDMFLKAGSADFNYVKNIPAASEIQSTIFGSPLNDLLWKQFKYTNFPIPLIPEELRTLKESNVETLMLNGSVDFTDPPENADEFLPYLKNGKKIILSEYGHVGDLRYFHQQMSDKIITNYINEGIADTSTAEYASMDFNVGMGFPFMFKAVLGLIAVIVVALSLVIF